MATIKIAHNSPSHANPSELETNIAQALFDLESSVSDLKAALRPLQFSSAKEVNHHPTNYERTTHPVYPSS
jgi:small subunit ribosomal protein S7e